MFEVHPSVSLLDIHTLINTKSQLSWILAIALVVLSVGLNIQSTNKISKRILVSLLLLITSIIDNTFLFIGVVELLFLVQTLGQERAIGEVGPARSATYLTYLLLAFLGMHHGSLLLSKFELFSVSGNRQVYLSFYLLLMWQLGVFEPIYKRFTNITSEKLSVKWPIQMAYLILFFKTSLPISQTPFLNKTLSIIIAFALLAHLVDFVESSKLRKIISHQYQFFKICIVFALICSNVSLAAQLFLMFALFFVILIYLTQAQATDDKNNSETQSKQIIASLNYGVVSISFLALCGFPFSPGFWLLCNITWISLLHANVFFMVSFLLTLSVLLFRTVDALMLLKNMEERTKQLGSLNTILPILVVLTAYTLSVMNLPASFGLDFSGLFDKMFLIDGLKTSISGKENWELITITFFAAFVLVCAATRVFITDAIVKALAKFVQFSAVIISKQFSNIILFWTKTFNSASKQYSSSVLKGQARAEEVGLRVISRVTRLVERSVNPDHMFIFLLLLGLALYIVFSFGGIR